MTNLPRAHQQRHQADVLSEETFWLAVEAAPNAMIMVDREGTIRLVNTQAERLFDYPRAALLGQPIELLLPDRFRACHPRDRDAFFATPTSRPMGAGRDLFGRRQDGTEVSIEIGLNPLETAEGTFVLASIIDITERKRAEEMRQHLVAIVESSDDAIISQTLEGLITSWNRGAQRLYGYTAQEVLGKPVSILIPPDLTDEFLQILERLSRGEYIDHYETQRLRKDGTRLDVSLTISPIRDASGRLIGASKIAHDITERKRAEERLRLVVEAAPNAIIMVARDGTMVLVNSQAEQLFGYPRQELIGQPIELLLPDRFRACHPRDRDAFFATPTSRPMGAGRDLFGRRQDGTEVSIEIGLNPLETAEGTFVLASIIDITERKRAEERFRLVVEAAPSALLMVDAHGAMTLVNSQTERLFGYSRDELLGQPVEMLVPERFRAALPGYREGFFQAPTTRAIGAGRDLFGLCKDGREVPIEIGLNPLRTEEGPLVLVSIIDITERAQAAQRLMNSLREKEVLLREIHHRVKNNLAVISSLLYLQSSTTQDEQTLRMLQNCRDRVYSMALVHERLYRSEDLASVDFAEYTEELTNQLFRHHVLSADTIRLKLDIETIPLDIDRAIPCGLILNELISNALKHAFPNGRSGEIRVSLQRTRNGGLVLSVADNGVGLPDEATLQARRSLGMHLVHSLATQLDTQIEFLRRNPGTEVRWRLETSHV
jgi:PAS domain S-box-containing protein